MLLSVHDSYTYGSAVCDVCRDIHFQSAAQTLQQIDEVGGRKASALLFNYFTTLALRYAVMMVIPQIKVCGFYSPSPCLSRSHTLLLDGLQSLAAVT